MVFLSIVLPHCSVVSCWGMWKNALKMPAIHERNSRRFYGRFWLCAEKNRAGVFRERLEFPERSGDVFVILQNNIMKTQRTRAAFNECDELTTLLFSVLLKGLQSTLEGSRNLEEKEVRLYAGDLHEESSRSIRKGEDMFDKGDSITELYFLQSCNVERILQAAYCDKMNSLFKRMWSFIIHGKRHMAWLLPCYDKGSHVGSFIHVHGTACLVEHLKEKQMNLHFQFPHVERSQKEASINPKRLH